MKVIFNLSLLFFSIVLLQAQRLSLNEVSSTAKFNRSIEEFNNGTAKIKYADIKGSPYYNAQFMKAKIGDTDTSTMVRYNQFLDTVEIVDKDEIYELPKEETNPYFTFESTKEKLVFVKTDDQYSGYFFELTDGKYRILKKASVQFQPETPAPNSMISGNPAYFLPQKPVYFIKTNTSFIKINKSEKDLAANVPENDLKTFMDNNKIKLQKEEDLIKLGNFLNQ